MGRKNSVGTANGLPNGERAGGAPGLGGQPPHSRQGVMGAFYIDVEKPDI